VLQSKKGSENGETKNNLMKEQGAQSHRDVTFCPAIASKNSRHLQNLEANRKECPQERLDSGQREVMKMGQVR
jgi:hypothetical protein